MSSGKGRTPFDENEYWDNNYVFMARHGEKGRIRNITVNDVRVESFGGSVRRFLGLRIQKHPWAKSWTPLGSISDIYFRNIRIDDASRDNVIAGHDGDHTIENIVFENLIISVCL